MARPKTIRTLRTPAVIDEIVDSLGRGITMRDICRRPGMPDWNTVYAWIRGDEELAKRIAHARELGADAIADEILEIMDTAAEIEHTQFGSKRDSGHVAWLKNRAELRLKLLAKWSPKKYGDKIGVEHSGSVELAGALEAARKRVSGGSDE